MGREGYYYVIKRIFSKFVDGGNLPHSQKRLMRLIRWPTNIMGSKTL